MGSGCGCAPVPGAPFWRVAAARAALGCRPELPATVLPAAARMRARSEFTATVRGGARAAAPSVTVHLRAGESGRPAPHVGFIVTRGVGGAVVRNRVRRRLRHLLRARLDRLPAGAAVVVRVSPAAVTASSADLARDVDRALGRATDRAAGR